MTMEEKRDALLREYLDDIVAYTSRFCHGTPCAGNMSESQKSAYAGSTLKVLETKHRAFETTYGVFDSAFMFTPKEAGDWEWAFNLIKKESRRAVARFCFSGKNWFKE